MTSPFGPLSEAEFREAVEAPFGGAATILRKHDPLWGKLPKSDGDDTPIKWKVRLEKSVRMKAFVTVDAVTEDEAELLASEIPDGKIVWDYMGEDDAGEVVEVEPA